jgi:Flp pilus assembly protein TadG
MVNNLLHNLVRRKIRNDRSGSSAFEFALVLPLFVVMMCGTLQYGILFYTWNVALNGARNAARAVAVGRTNVAGGQGMMRNALPAWVTVGGGGGIVSTVTDAPIGGEVVASVQFPSSSATFLPLAPMPENVSVTVRMVKEA